MTSTLFLRDLPVTTSLAELGFEALKLFEQVQSVDGRKTPQEWHAAPFAAEAERFELWAVNLGLFVTGHGSLDYRIREADRLTQTIKRFMKELMESLAEVIQIRTDGEDVHPLAGSKDEGYTGDTDDYQERDDTDSEISGDDSHTETDLDLLLDGVRDPIDRLYKVSTKIRNPSSRLGSSRAATYQQIDEDTGVDFLRAVEEADHDHICSLFLQYQKVRALQEAETVEANLMPDTENNEDGVWEPIRTVLAQHRAVNSYLIRRAAKANVRRRQQFAYRKVHREKLARHTQASISTQTVLTPGTEHVTQPSFERRISDDSFLLPTESAPPALSVTTATNLNLARLDISENQSVVDVSEYAPSVWQPARDAVAFPPPPRTQSDDTFFECPYCFTICPKGILAAKAWKAHLIHDLSPYICTYENCKNPDQLYDDRHDWTHHENTCHRKVWRCPEHSAQIFFQLDAYRDHVNNEHSNYIDGASVDRIIRSSESIMAATDRPCPVCSVVLETPKAMQSHIALHLERFSLFSLPRSVVCAGDDANEVENTDSEKANCTNEDSRDEDFDGDSDVKSEHADDRRKTSESEHKTSPSTVEGVEGPTSQSESILPTERPLEVKIALTEETLRAMEIEVKQDRAPRSPPIPDVSMVSGVMEGTFEDHNSPIYTVAFSLGDNVLASVSDDRMIRLWDAEHRKSLPSLEGHKRGFRSLAWSHDGRIIASGSYDKTIKLWDAHTHTCLRTLTGHGGAVSGLSFSSDDTWLASASHDKTCKLWTVDTGIERCTLEGHTVGVWSVGISPDDKYVISGSNDRTIKTWDPRTGRLLRTLRGHSRVIYSLTFTPDSQTLATGGNDMTLKLWDLASGELIRSIKAHDKGITALAFSPNGSLMASGSYDHLIKIWETKTWTSICVLEGHTADVYAVAFSRSGDRIASGSRDRTLRLWNLILQRSTLDSDPVAQPSKLESLQLLG